MNAKPMLLLAALLTCLAIPISAAAGGQQPARADHVTAPVAGPTGGEGHEDTLKDLPVGEVGEDRAGAILLPGDEALGQRRE